MSEIPPYDYWAEDMEARVGALEDQIKQADVFISAMIKEGYDGKYIHAINLWKVRIKIPAFKTVTEDELQNTEKEY